MSLEYAGYQLNVSLAEDGPRKDQFVFSSSAFVKDNPATDAKQAFIKAMTEFANSEKFDAIQKSAINVEMTIKVYGMVSTAMAT